MQVESQYSERRGRHAKAEEVHALDEVHAHGRQAEEGASEGAHGGGVGGLSGADHQMPAGERPGQGVVGIKSSGEGAAAALLKPCCILRQLCATREKSTV